MYLIIFAVLLLIILISFISLLIKGIRLAVKQIRHRKERKIGFMGNGILLAASVLLCIAFIFFTQITASTPKIRDEKGKVIAGSIAELRRVELNGRKEWISIRGYDRKKPILLFLAGGPGGSQMAAQRYELAEL